MFVRKSSITSSACKMRLSLICYVMGGYKKNLLSFLLLLLLSTDQDLVWKFEGQLWIENSGCS